MRSIGAFVLIAILAGSHAYSQKTVELGSERKDRKGSSILDDSTKQIYGPTTSQYTYENNVKYNNPRTYTIDTLIKDFHRYQFLIKENSLYQDLGNIGTASYSIYPNMPEVIGATPALTIYDLYYQGPDKVKYYNTRSPYSRFGIIWGGNGRAITEASYTRNVDSRSNFGFDYRGLLIDKQIDRVGRGDRNVVGTYYALHGNYKTKDGRYQALANFTRNRHHVDEYGGVLYGIDSTLESYFHENRRGSLSSAETQELRTNYHLYHQYKVKDALQLYHSFDRHKQQNDYINDKPETDSLYFGPVVIDSSTVKDRSKFIYQQHEVGVKGDWGKTFYNFYYKGRNLDFNYKFIYEDSLHFEADYLENYLGARFRFGNDSVSYAEAYAEYLQGGHYKLGGSIKNSWFFGEAMSTRYVPGFMYQAYRGRYDEWYNDFESPISTSVLAGLILGGNDLVLRPSASYGLYSNYLYFYRTVQDDRPRPRQASADISLIKLDAELRVLFWRHFSFVTRGIYSIVGGGSADAMRVPDFMVNAQLAYHNILFNGNLELHVGFDYHQQTSYYGNGYDPALMQYFVQDEFEIPTFPVVDFFANFKINRGRAFIKVNNIYQAINGTGYFAAPYYPAQNTIADFGFDWSFYD